MQPLLGLALAMAPELITPIANDPSGALAARVAGLAQQCLGTREAGAAQRKLAGDPALALALRTRLVEFALQTHQASGPPAPARAAAATGPATWGAPVVSIIVTLGFFGILLALIVDNARHEPEVASMINITVGALAAAFATVVNFWLGSSQGSRNKDAAGLCRHRIAVPESASRPGPRA